jgi:hypothetical protein
MIGQPEAKLTEDFGLVLGVGAAQDSRDVQLPAEDLCGQQPVGPRLTSPLRDTVRSTSTAGPSVAAGSGDGPAGTAPPAASLPRSATDR